jgi:hypothetical protein
VLDDGVHPPIPLSIKQLRHFPAIDPYAHKPILLPPDVYETRSDLINRMHRIVDALLERIEQEDTNVETILLASHGSPVWCIAKALLGNDPHDLHTYTAGVSKFTRVAPDRMGSWELTWNCRVDFLSGGGERDTSDLLLIITYSSLLGHFTLELEHGQSQSIDAAINQWLSLESRPLEVRPCRDLTTLCNLQCRPPQFGV